MGKKKTKGDTPLGLKLAVVASAGILVFSLATNKVLAIVTIVSPSNMQGWSFEINSPDGFGTFVQGPGTPPLGEGSVRLFSGTRGDLSISLNNVTYIGVNLRDVTKLQHSGFSTTQSNQSINQPFLYISVQTDGGPDTLIFDPNAQNLSAQVNVWQHWDTKNDGKWKSNIKLTEGTLSEYIEFLENVHGPNIVLTGLKFQVGPAAQSDIFDGYVDNFAIGVGGGDLVYDFEPDVEPTPSTSPSPTPSVPTDKEQCKNGGWNAFRNPAFQNQGDCISFLNKKI